jgi:V/A-type H+/Na+-transporting ATPase subunit I
MIEKMKKVSVLVKSSELIPSLNHLRKSGVLHISESGTVHSEAVDREEQQLAMIDRVIAAVPAKTLKTPTDTAATFADKMTDNQIGMHDVMSFCREIDFLLTQRKEYHDRIEELRQIAGKLEAWGDFSPEDLEFLHDHGLSLLPAEISQKDLAHIRDNFTFVTLKKRKKQAFVAFFNAREDELPASSRLLRIPDMGLSGIEKETRLIENHISKIDARLEAEYSALPMVRDVRRIIASDLHLRKIQDNMHSDGPVSWLTGFIPAANISDFKTIAAANAWGLLIEDPSEADPVPTKMKNNWVVRMIQPVFNLLGTVPGYKEYDVSMFFLMFFTVFVAMIIGDAGYGVIFLAAAAVLHIKTRKASELIRLIYVLSISTIIWGTITGTWFGSSSIASLPFLKQLVIPQITSFPELFAISNQEVSETVMYICFVLGIIQLSLACIINFIRQFPELRAVSQIGSLSLLIGLYTLTLNLVLGKTFPQWGLYAIVAGLAIIVTFGAQEKGKGFFSGFLKGLAGLFTTFLDSIGSFSNIISYIRLFAVGMSSVAIASSFNNIAAGIPGGFALAAALLVLLIGHGLNIVMGLLSVIVHGVRLNMLEFSGQLGMEWSGTEYSPVSEYRSRYFKGFYENM